MKEERAEKLETTLIHYMSSSFSDEMILKSSLEEKDEKTACHAGKTNNLFLIFFLLNKMLKKNNQDKLLLNKLLKCIRFAAVSNKNNAGHIEL